MGVAREKLAPMRFQENRGMTSRSSRDKRVLIHTARYFGENMIEPREVMP